jgi:uncharacterized protein YgiB involved in biofilm formation
MRNALRFVGLIGLIGFGSLLGGCGKSSSTQRASSPSDTRGVIVSASDCTAFGDDAVKACSSAIERAVASHEASSAQYNNIEACEKAVGTNGCERSAAGTYRPRLSAFMVTIGKGSASAEPLYPVKGGGVGFQTASASKFMANDQSVVFSRLAMSVAESQATASGKKGKKVF